MTAGKLVGVVAVAEEAGVAGGAAVAAREEVAAGLVARAHTPVQLEQLEH